MVLVEPIRNFVKDVNAVYYVDVEEDGYPSTKRDYRYLGSILTMLPVTNVR